MEAQDGGDITDAERIELSDLREVRTKLRRLDLTGAPDDDWAGGADIGVARAARFSGCWIGPSFRHSVEFHGRGRLITGHT